MSESSVAHLSRRALQRHRQLHSALRRHLELERSANPVLTCTWTLRHKIDERSPLHQISAATAGERILAIYAPIVGTDEVYMQTVGDRHVYHADDLRFGQRFVDFVRVEPCERKKLWLHPTTGFVTNRLVVDRGLLHVTRPADGEASVPRPESSI